MGSFTKQTFSVTKETFIGDDSQTTNYGHWSSLLLRNFGGLERRGICTWDLSGRTFSVPQIVFARIGWFVDINGETNVADDFYFRRATKLWTETDASWRDAAFRDRWGAAGGDWTTTGQAGPFSLPLTGNTFVWYSSNAITELVKDAIELRSDLLDLFVIITGTSHTEEVDLRTKEHADDDGPLLEISYVDPRVSRYGSGSVAA